MKRIFYYLIFVVDGWLIKMLKIVEKLSGLYNSMVIVNKALQMLHVIYYKLAYYTETSLI